MSIKLRNLTTKTRLATWIELIAVGLAGTGQTHADPARSNLVRGIEASSDGGQTTVRIQGTTKPTFTMYKVARPERLVIDIANATPGSSVPGVSEPFLVGSFALSEVALQERPERSSQLLRVTIRFARESVYEASAVGNDAVVHVTSI